MRTIIKIVFSALIVSGLCNCRDDCESLNYDFIRFAQFKNKDRIVFVNQDGDSLIFKQVFQDIEINNPRDPDQIDLCHSSATTIIANPELTKSCSIFIDRVRNNSTLSVEIYSSDNGYYDYGVFSISLKNIEEISSSITINEITYEDAIIIENGCDNLAEYKNCVLAKNHGIVKFESVSDGDTWMLCE